MDAAFELLSAKHCGLRVAWSSVQDTADTARSFRLGTRMPMSEKLASRLHDGMHRCGRCGWGTWRCKQRDRTCTCRREIERLPAARRPHTRRSTRSVPPTGPGPGPGEKKTLTISDNLDWSRSSESLLSAWTLIPWKSVRPLISPHHGCPATAGCQREIGRNIRGRVNAGRHPTVASDLVNGRLPAVDAVIPQPEVLGRKRASMGSSATRSATPRPMSMRLSREC